MAAGGGKVSGRSGIAWLKKAIGPPLSASDTAGRRSWRPPVAAVNRSFSSDC